MRSPPLGHGRQVVASAVATTILVVAPVHLLGALAVLVREDLGFDRAALGTAFAMYQAGSILSSIPGGRLSERLGPRRAMITAACMSAAAMVSIALFAHSWWQLAAILSFAGLANGLGQPAASLALSIGVRGERQGMAFGMKQAAVPAAGLLAGLAVPAIGLTIGWRWAFAAGAIGAVVVAVASPTFGSSRQAHPTLDTAPVVHTSGRPPVGLIVAFALASASATTTPAFLAETAAAAGYSSTFAGLVIAGGSAIGLISRLYAGRQADRRGGRHFRVVAIMLALGSLGHIGLAFGATNVVIILLGAGIAYGAGWGWPGLLLYAIVRLYPDRPGVAAGRIQAGATVGALLGPFGFGWLVTVSTFKVAWLTVAFVSLLASASIMLSRQRMIKVASLRPAQAPTAEA
jgi:MFS family permease